MNLTRRLRAVRLLLQPFEKAIAQMRALKEQGATVLPIMSENACNTDTRFGRASDIVWEIEDICGRKIIKSIVEAEPIGPKKMCDIIVVAPCTGNTLAKLLTPLQIPR